MLDYAQTNFGKTSFEGEDESEPDWQCQKNSNRHRLNALYDTDAYKLTKTMEAEQKLNKMALDGDKKALFTMLFVYDMSPLEKYTHLLSNDYIQSEQRFTKKELFGKRSAPADPSKYLAKCIDRECGVLNADERLIEMARELKSENAVRARLKQLKLSKLNDQVVSALCKAGCRNKVELTPREKEEMLSCLLALIRHWTCKAKSPRVGLYSYYIYQIAKKIGVKDAESLKPRKHLRSTERTAKKMWNDLQPRLFPN